MIQLSQAFWDKWHAEGAQDLDRQLAMQRIFNSPDANSKDFKSHTTYKLAHEPTGEA